MRGRERPFVFYSRLGEFLVRDQSTNVPWDGYYLGDLVTEGLYVYIIHGNYMDPLKGGRSFDKSGTVMVLDGRK